MTDELWRRNDEIPPDGVFIEYIVNGDKHIGQTQYEYKDITINNEPHLKIWIRIKDKLFCSFSCISQWRLA